VRELYLALGQDPALSQVQNLSKVSSTCFGDKSLRHSMWPSGQARLKHKQGSSSETVLALSLSGGVNFGLDEP
ncbi:uncharacterized protein METZ01_LOCUS158218, partial [marine metagenome]